MTQAGDAFQKYEEELVAKKTREVQTLARESIVKYWIDAGLQYPSEMADVAAGEIVSNFIRVTPPKLDTTMKFITLSAGGRQGGSSAKPGNLVLNFRKLLTAIAGGVITVAGIVEAPWTAPFAALVIWDSLWSGLKIELSEREAAVLWAMWKNCDHNDRINEDHLFDCLNRELKSNGRSPVSHEQLKDALDILSKMSCVKRVVSINNTWWLCEWVKTTY